jgi:ABC-2 type transport system permease protein
VGLTQLLLWIVLTIGISSGATIFLASQMESSKTEMVLKEAAKQRTSALQVPNTQNTIQEQNQPEQADVLTEVKQALGTINMPLVVACFLFYFLGGYFLYGSMFAAVGAAGDSETDAQQFTLPISIPLIISFMAASAIIKDPGSTLATVLSIFPLTSPIIMMVRIPFGVPAWDIVASMVSLIIGFVTFTWLASRIYRVGILMYGKKITYKELSKWIFYKF